MFKSYADKVTSVLIHNDAISKEDYELYSYGFETLISFIVNIIVILFIGFVFDKFGQTLLFLACYCPIRQFTGGYHANSYRNCLLLFILIFLINMCILNNLVYKNFNEIVIGLTFISCIGIYLLAPVEHRDNPLSNEDKRHYKKVAITLVSIVFIFAIIGINFKTTYEYSLYSASAVNWIFIMLILSITKKNRRNREMKKYPTLILKYLGSLSVFFVSLSANTTSNWIAHQPKRPSEVNKFKKIK